MSNSGFGWYLNSIGRVPLLTPAEELHLGQLVRTWLDHPDGPDNCPAVIRRRGLRARDRMVSANLRLAVDYVKRRCSNLVPSWQLEDLHQATAMGLLRAVEKYDPTKGYKFSTYAFWWLKQSANRFLDTEVRSVKIPAHHSHLISRLTIATREYLAATGTMPSPEELAESLNLRVDMVRLLLEESKNLRTCSLDQSVGDDDTKLGELLPSDPDSLIEDALLDRLHEGMARLPPLERKVLNLLYGDKPVSQSMAAHVLGITVRKVNEIKARAFRYIRQPVKKTTAERFAARVDGQLEFTSHLKVTVANRARIRRDGAKRRLQLKGSDMTESAINQMLLLENG